MLRCCRPSHQEGIVDPDAEHAGFLAGACDTYSLFGSFGNGFGGVTMQCRGHDNLERIKLSKVLIYPGGWVHIFKSQGMLVVKPPFGAKSLWTQPGTATDHSARSSG